MSLEAQLEAILFFKGEPVKRAQLASYLNVSVEQIDHGLKKLEQQLVGRGVGLVFNNNEVMLTTAPEASDLISKLIKEELDRNLGKAGIETLTIILYQGPLSRREIDYIRGVNSTFILRHLLIRGLIDKTPNPKDQRSFLYKPTLELLNWLGIKRLEDLPEWRSVRQELTAFKDQPDNNNPDQSNES